MANITELRINGARVRVDTDEERPLLSVLRDDLDLTGAKYGCGEGQCGACTVLMDGMPIRSCITPCGAVRAREVSTVEGLEQGGRLHPVQEAFLEAGALQCGYCTSGMIMSAVALFRRNPRPTEAEIAHAMQGNLCRCCTYPRILSALAALSKSGKAARR